MNNQEEQKDEELRLYVRLGEVINCSSVICDIIQNNKNATAFDCLDALIKRRKDIDAKINESIIKEIIE